jgi:hypothetical protein
MNQVLILIGLEPGKDRHYELARIVFSPSKLDVSSYSLEMKRAVIARLSKQNKEGGFAYRTGRFTPNEENWQQHRTYVVPQTPGDKYFIRALKDTVQRWDGEMLLGYEVDGFSSYLAED